MAKLNDLGHVIARCPGCEGSTSTYEYLYNGSPLGIIKSEFKYQGQNWLHHHRLFRCAGCGLGGIGLFRMYSDNYPREVAKFVSFHEEVLEKAKLPNGIPEGIKNEFEEGEKCLENMCFRAAAGMFRSVLDKTLRENGYKINKNISLNSQIDLAAEVGIITAARKKRAHDEIRVLGNDVLHDEWHEIPEEDVLAARHYTQRILEDFYDERKSVLKILSESGRITDEDSKQEKETE